jgi:hypothetical protein
MGIEDAVTLINLEMIKLRRKSFDALTFDEDGTRIADDFWNNIEDDERDLISEVERLQSETTKWKTRIVNETADLRTLHKELVAELDTYYECGSPVCRKFGAEMSLRIFHKHDVIK